MLKGIADIRNDLTPGDAGAIPKTKTVGRFIVADIIPLEEKLNLLKNKKDALNRRRKIQAVQNVFRCLRCAFKCEKCGAGIDHHDESRSVDVASFKTPYHFCDSCREEYNDYIHHLKGQKNPENYWYNTAWSELWRKWIEYQGSLDNYLRSKEFKSLLMELKKTTPDNEEV